MRFGYFGRKSCSIKNIKLSPVSTVGVVAGASAPEELIMEVKVYMSQNIGEVSVSDELKAGVEESFVSYREGKRVKGKVISADEKGIKLSIGGKYDGIIYKNEVNIDGSYDPEQFTEGMEIEAIIIGKKDPETDCIPLSKKKVDLILEGDKVVDSIRDGSVLKLPLVAILKAACLQDSELIPFSFPRLTFWREDSQKTSSLSLRRSCALRFWK